MKVKELREFLESLPECYDDCPVVSFQAEVEQYFNGSNDEVRVKDFRDIELKRVNVDIGKVRIN